MFDNRNKKLAKVKNALRNFHIFNKNPTKFKDKDLNVNNSERQFSQIMMV